MILVTGATGNAGGAVLRARRAGRGGARSRPVREHRAAGRGGDSARRPRPPREHDRSLVGCPCDVSALRLPGRAPEFMSNSLRWSAQVRSGDVVRAPFADVSVAVIDPRDIAETAVTALVDGGHEGECYRLSGPQSLLPEERVRMLAAALGRELRF